MVFKALVSALVLRCGAAGPIVGLYGGPAEGVAWGDVGVWRGIPFAQPPVGDLRWAPPKPARNWTGTLDATEFKHNCMQSNDTYMGWLQPSSTMSEDCLYLNVYAPLQKPQEPKPVLLWIFGGGYQGGGGNETRLNGTWDVALECGEFVIVTFSYRLNVFGFAASDLLRERDPQGGTGNYGILDQRMAMRWAQANIAAFGGDPSRVFIVGESAGANSVSNHLVRKESWGLFAAAGMESGAFYRQHESTVADVEGDFAALMQEFGCSDVACLQDVPAETLEHAKHNPQWNPVIDGVDLVDAGTILASKGLLAPVPVLVGNNMEDIDGLSGNLKCNANSCTEKHFRSWAKTLFNESQAERLTALYSDEVARPGGDNTNWWWARKRAGADKWATCASRRMARWTTAVGQKAYRYYWTYVPKGFNGRYPTGAHHSLEQPFVFHVLSESPAQEQEDRGAYHIQPEEADFSAAVVHYWTSFAKSFKPEGDVHWPSYDEATQRALIIGDLDGSASSLTFEVAKSFRDAKCDFWDEQFEQDSVTMALV